MLVTAALSAAVAVRAERSSRPTVPAPLPAATQASYVASADRLAQRYVEDAWCGPLMAGTVGTVPAWPRTLATAGARRALTTGPPVGAMPAVQVSRTLDVSDARAVLPPRGRSWSLRPRFCVAQLAHPRLVTTGGTTHPAYGPLPHRLRSIEQIFERFPRYLGTVEDVAVPITIEVAYQLTVGRAAPENFHLWWVTTLGLVPVEAHRVRPSPRRALPLRLSTWDVGGRGAWVTVDRDAPSGPVVVHSSPPGSGP